jgi:hypothetical protein
MRFTLEFASESHEELGLVWLKASFSSVQANDVMLVMVFLVLDVVLLLVLVHTFFRLVSFWIVWDVVVHFLNLFCLFSLQLCTGQSRTDLKRQGLAFAQEIINFLG